MKQTRIIIAGGRDFTDRALVEKCLIEWAESLQLEPEEITVVSGGAPGADTLGESLAREFCCNLCIYPANWDKFGRGAGHVRNSLMANNAEYLLAFWNGKSPGTKSMIEKAQNNGLKVTVISY